MNMAHHICIFLKKISPVHLLNLLLMKSINQKDFKNLHALHLVMKSLHNTLIKFIFTSSMILSRITFYEEEYI